MVHAGAFFEVSDGELHGGVIAVVFVSLDHGGGQAGDEGVVTPVGPELWASPQSVEASTMRSSDARDTKEVRPRVP